MEKMKFKSEAIPALIGKFNPSGKCQAAESYFSKKTGKIQFSPVCLNKWQPGCNLKGNSQACNGCSHKQPGIVDLSVMTKHIIGNTRYGVYPALPDALVQCIVADIDGHLPGQDARKDTKTIMRVASDMDISVMVFSSNSGNGYHVYLFFSEPVPYIKARGLMDHILSRCPGLSAFDCVKPTKEAYGTGGGLIALPFHKTAFDAKRSTVPVDNELNSVADNFDDCLQYFIDEYNPISTTSLDEIIRLYNIDVTEKPAPEPIDAAAFSGMQGQLSTCVQYIISQNPKTEKTNFNRLCLTIIKYMMAVKFTLETALNVCGAFLTSYPHSGTYTTPKARMEHFTGLWRYLEGRADSQFFCSYVLGMGFSGDSFDCSKCQLTKPNEEIDDFDKYVIDASEYLEHEPPEPDQIIKNLFDTGDKMAVIASSKQKKSMFVCQMALSISSGKTSFFNFGIPKPRNVLLVQLEVKGDHFHRRVRRISKALNIKASDIYGKLFIVNGRGLNLFGADGVRHIQKIAERRRADVVIIDPFYKLNDGIENAVEGMRSILAAFDALVEQTGAGLIYVHHDAKGAVGEKALTDRGSGSGVMGRDYDSALFLTPHCEVEDATVLEVVQRNYAPIKPDVIMWKINSGESYCFECDCTLAPDKQTQKQKVKPPPPSAYVFSAYKILEDREVDVSIFKPDFKDLTGLSDSRVKEFMAWATAGDDPCLIARSERGRGVNKKWLRFSENHIPATGNINVDLSGV